MRLFRRRVGASLLLLGAFAGGASSATADPLVCVTVYYRVNNGPPQYLANNVCKIPTGWGPAVGYGPSCPIDTNQLDICASVTVSGP